MQDLPSFNIKLAKKDSLAIQNYWTNTYLPLISHLSEIDKNLVYEFINQWIGFALLHKHHEKEPNEHILEYRMPRFTIRAYLLVVDDNM